MDEPGLAVVAGHWRERRSELSYVTRSLAGAASRWARVNVLIPGTGAIEPDGAFEPVTLGEGAALRWPAQVSKDCHVIVDEPTPEFAHLLSDVAPDQVFTLTTSKMQRDLSWGVIPLSPTRPGSNGSFAKLFVPVHELAKTHRHNAFGFTGYLLILTGRIDVPGVAAPELAWLSAAFAARDVIAVENGVASAWRGRALRGRASVDSRMDLWRLMAHADLCVDLAPGAYIARECVEAMRFGIPIVVPTSSGVAAVHAGAGTGGTFADPKELLDTVGGLRGANREVTAQRAQHYADRNYGDPADFVRSMRSVLLGRDTAD